MHFQLAIQEEQCEGMSKGSYWLCSLASYEHNQVAKALLCFGVVCSSGFAAEVTLQIGYSTSRVVTDCTGGGLTFFDA